MNYLKVGLCLNGYNSRCGKAINVPFARGRKLYSGDATGNGANVAYVRKKILSKKEGGGVLVA